MFNSKTRSFNYALTLFSLEIMEFCRFSVSPQSSLMHSAAGIAAAAAAIHSSASAGNSSLNADVPGVASSSHTTSLYQNVVPKENKDREVDTVKSGINSTSEKSHVSKELPTKMLLESSSDVVSSTMDEEEENMETYEAPNAHRHEEKRRKAKNKVKRMNINLI